MVLVPVLMLVLVLVLVLVTLRTARGAKRSKRRHGSIFPTPASFTAS